MLARLQLNVHVDCGGVACVAKNGRSEWIRTTGPYVPNVVLYQAELHPDSRGRGSLSEA